MSSGSGGVLVVNTPNMEQQCPELRHQLAAPGDGLRVLIKVVASSGDTNDHLRPEVGQGLPRCLLCSLSKPLPKLRAILEHLVLRLLAQQLNQPQTTLHFFAFKFKD